MFELAWSSGSALYTLFFFVETDSHTVTVAQTGLKFLLILLPQLPKGMSGVIVYRDRISGVLFHTHLLYCFLISKFSNLTYVKTYPDLVEEEKKQVFVSLAIYYIAASLNKGGLRVSKLPYPTLLHSLGRASLTLLLYVLYKLEIEGKDNGRF